MTEGKRMNPVFGACFSHCVMSGVCSMQSCRVGWGAGGRDFETAKIKPPGFWKIGHFGRKKNENSVYFREKKPLVSGVWMEVNLESSENPEYPQPNSRGGVCIHTCVHYTTPWTEVMKAFRAMYGTSYLFWLMIRMQYYSLIACPNCQMAVCLFNNRHALCSQCREYLIASFCQIMRTIWCEFCTSSGKLTSHWWAAWTHSLMYLLSQMLFFLQRTAGASNFGVLCIPFDFPKMSPLWTIYSCWKVVVLNYRYNRDLVALFGIRQGQRIPNGKRVSCVYVGVHVVFMMRTVYVCQRVLFISKEIV